jgi:hypothetical protein
MNIFQSFQIALPCYFDNNMAENDQRFYRFIVEIKERCSV